MLIHLEFRRPDFSFWTLVFTRHTSTYCLIHDLMKIDDYSNLKRWLKKWMLCVCFFNDYSTEERRLNWISVGGKQNTFGNTNTDLKILTLKMLRKSKRTQTHTITYPVKKKNWTE